jgi:hypothetical protein
VKLFAQTFTGISNKVKPPVIRIWSEYLGIPDKPELTSSYFEMIRGRFYSSVTVENFDYEFIRTLSAEVKVIIEAMMRSESSVE